MDISKRWQTMKKLVLCGCSLGDSWMPYFDLAGYDNVTRSKKKWDTTKIQLSGGGHGYMVTGLHDYFLTNDYKSTIIVQLTGINRETLVTSEKYKREKTIINKLTQKKEYYHSINFARDMDIKLSGNYNYVNLVSSLCMLSKLGADVYVFRGWQNITDPTWSDSKKYMKESGITFTELDYLSECIKLSTKEEDWRDDQHPQDTLGTKAFDNIWKELNYGYFKKVG
tara:strand:+ start:162 stop:836 length:675 start_codon:yes stop_codon:yes gene_type:complete